MTDKIPSNNPLPNKERSKLPRQRVPEQDPQVRAHNFKEVNLGFPAEQARQESLRCIECPKPGCVTKCPVSVNVRAVIDLILAGDYLGAASKVPKTTRCPRLPDASVRSKTSAKLVVCWARRASRSELPTWNAS